MSRLEGDDLSIVSRFDALQTELGGSGHSELEQRLHALRRLVEDRLRRGEGYRLDPARVEAAVWRSLDAQGVLDDLRAAPLVSVDDATVTVTLDGRVEHVFAKALPGADDTTRVRARGSATAVSR